MNDDRRIAHLDMDAFFASVELLSYPQLRGMPVVVGGRNAVRASGHALEPGEFARLRDYAGRGVVTTSTYEARALGVYSGMGLMKSAQLAPDAILLPANFDAYRHYSRLFKSAVAACAPLIEDRGIDEIYIDLSAIPEQTVALAQRIKQAVTANTGLTCSIGVAMRVAEQRRQQQARLNDSQKQMPSPAALTAEQREAARKKIEVMRARLRHENTNSVSAGRASFPTIPPIPTRH